MTARRGLLAAAVVLIAALLAWWVWPGDDGKAAQHMAAGPYLVDLRVPGGSPRTGDNTVELDITDQGGSPVAPEKVSVEPAMPQMGHALPPSVATTDAPGHYRATVNLPMPGQWEIAVNLSGSAGTGRATFAVRVN
ncbi:FixH family protein [Nocardia jejuensis]|uniref:FixH family protein n=1 Tax=Nocardia jejuensis TaxID=328049 RepID=UPI000829A2EA|nr:FixH family protein [Nocardia jejuensis]